MTGVFEAVDEHELAVLEQACRVRDVLDALDRELRKADGLIVAGRVHPALVEQRLQAITLARLLAALRLPDEDEARPQRRSSRGVYQQAKRAKQAHAAGQRERLIAAQGWPVQ